MTLNHLKPGDRVVVRLGKWCDDPTYEIGVVVRVMKVALKLEDGRVFSLNRGVQQYDHSALSADIIEWTDELKAKLGVEA